MKNILLLLLSFTLLNCGSNNSIVEEKTEQNSITGTSALEYSKIISPEDLKKHLYIIASDEYEGRDTGEPGQKLAVNYLKNFYISKGISSAFGDTTYFQHIPTEHLTPKTKPSENVLAFIEGTEKPEEIIVVSAHLDHLGMKNEEIYNGADDNGSGTVAIIKIGQAFQEAKENGNGPKRSILLLHVTGEEKGLLGSKYYVNHPVFPLENTIANLNIDMIGRVDDAHEKNPEFVYLIGSDKLSSELHKISEEINSNFTNLTLDYKYNDDNDPNRFYYRSDHYSFAKNNIPIIFYFNGTHDDYHRPSDTPDKINYEVLAKRAQLVFLTAWELANRENRITVDK